MANYLFTDKDRLRNELSEIENLEVAYTKIASMHSQQNKQSAINAYRSWYNKVAVICNAVFGKDDDDVKEFRELDNNCNGYGMYDNFVAIEGTYSILKDRLKSCLETTNQPMIQNNTAESTSSNNKEPLVFISHAGNDKEIIDIFIDFILKNTIGLKDENIICTSFEKNTVSIGNDIPLYIKEKIASSTVVISAVSKSYKESEVCMNEVGAAWALNKEPLQIVLPDADFDDLGWLLETRKAAQMIDKSSLSSFVSALCHKLLVKEPSLQTWTDYSSKFYEALEMVDLHDQPAKPQVYLTFPDGAEDCEVHVPIGVTHYVFPSRQANNTSALNNVVFGGSGLDAAFAPMNAVNAHIEVVSPRDSVNKSMIPINLLFNNEGGCLEDVHIILTGEGMKFDSTNEKKAFAVLSARINNRIDDDGCDFDLKNCNAESNYKVPKFYLEFPNIYKDSGVYEFCGNEKYDFYLDYTISTKHKKFNGQLKLHVIPDYQEEYKENEQKSGQSFTHPFEVNK